MLDVLRYELWRERTNPDWEAIGEELLDAVHEAAARYRSFAEIPFKPLQLLGQISPVKRILVVVRSKVFLVYVGRGRRGDQISVRRVRHPSQRPIHSMGKLGRAPLPMGRDHDGRGGRDGDRP